MLATVGVPPTTETAPPLTRMLPAALRLTVMLLSSESPVTVSVPLLNDPVTAALAVALVTASTPMASTPPVTNRRTER